MSIGSPIIHWIEPERCAREAAAAILAAENIACRCYETAEEFLDRFDPHEVGCVVSEISLPGMGGLELLQTVLARAAALPVILISGEADVRMAVEAMRSGAMTFIEKPFGDGELLEAVRLAVELSVQRHATDAARDDVLRRWAGLAPRERQIADLVIDGKTNKCISRLLGTCERTIERLRARVFRAMGVDSAPQLARQLALVRQPELEDAPKTRQIYRIMPRHTLVRPVGWPPSSALDAVRSPEQAAG